jgi:hypothetical protein
MREGERERERGREGERVVREGTVKGGEKQGKWEETLRP